MIAASASVITAPHSIIVLRMALHSATVPRLLSATSSAWQLAHCVLTSDFPGPSGSAGAVAAPCACSGTDGQRMTQARTAAPRASSNEFMLPHLIPEYV